jgi:hypothetical protein
MSAAGKHFKSVEATLLGLPGFLLQLLMQYVDVPAKV